MSRPPQQRPKSSYPANNALSPQMPSYLLNNPNTVVLGKNNQGWLAKDVDLNASQVA